MNCVILSQDEGRPQRVKGFLIWAYLFWTIMEENIVLSIEELQEKWFFNRFVRKLEREILNTLKIRESRKEFEEYYDIISDEDSDYIFIIIG